ncbi:complex I NDUFA9 subunit family protein [Acidisphaera sp. L21]|uniref:complex I NDUFA9 subunit family protein n=1 Tax=Acidisphaera sp. L21 TaxID=1641851 RepID=UPI00131BB176|nr:complex I NDUFA9 subunit family protein [Acidisphaera sp. L21]
MTATRSVATVFGGTGFLGRYVVKRLANAGYVTRVAVRDPEGAMFLKPMGRVGQVVPMFSSLGQEATIARAVEAAELVVNLIGMLAERKAGDFQRIQAEGAGRIARLAAAAGAKRMVQISAIGADTASPSIYARTKAEGEQSVLAAMPSATILRPSLVFGMEDKFFNRFAAMASVLPFMPVISGDTEMQPVYVGDVSDAVMAGLTLDSAPGKTYELGGPQIWTFREILAYILKETRRNRRLVNIPMGMARFQASIAEKIPTKPFTRDQLLMLSRNNVVSADMPGLPQLGIVPTPLELVVPEYLNRYRPGGGKLERIPA